MPVIDAHVHLYPPEMCPDPATWAVAHGEPHWSVMCARIRKTTGRPVQAFPSVDDVLRGMDTAGVDRSVLLGWYWENHDTCVRQNRFFEECVRAHPDRFSAFATVHAAAGEEAVREVRRAKDAGLIGLGELSPHSQHIAADSPLWSAVLTLAGELNMPVNVHVTDPLVGKYPGRVETPLTDFLTMARRFPKVRFILAHWGGRLWREAGALQENVWVDTAASPLLYGAGAGIWRDGLVGCGAERVLWGTDYPLDLYPREPGKETWAGFLAEAREHVDADDADDVLGGNAARLFGVG